MTRHPNTFAYCFLFLLSIGQYCACQRDGSGQARNQDGGAGSANLKTKHVPVPSLGDRRTLIMTLSRSSCYGICPVYTLNVHGDGRVEYEGKCEVAVVGHHESHLPRHTVKTLFELFRKADFFSLADRYGEYNIDMPITEISISFDGYEKKVIHHFMGRKTDTIDGLVLLENSLDGATHSNQWIVGQARTYLEGAKHPCR